MSSGIIAKTAARLLVPFIIIFGFYVVMHGHLSPGGGFQGGAIAATAIALVVVAFSYADGKELVSSAANIKLYESAGLILFICTALAGIAVAGGLLFNWLAGAGGLFGNPVAYASTVSDLWTGGVIPVLNFAIGIEVFGALSVVVLYMFKGLRETTKAEDDAAEKAAAEAKAQPKTKAELRETKKQTKTAKTAAKGRSHK